MQQALLEDRIKLKVHHETRELPIFALVVAKGGLKMQEGRLATPIRMVSKEATARLSVQARSRLAMGRCRLREFRWMLWQRN